MADEIAEGPHAAGLRLERDTLGEVAVPRDALYGAQTQRAVENFRLSGLRMPRGWIRALGLIKAAAARAHAELGLLAPERAAAIAAAADEVAAGRHDAHFPVDVFQTGSGTSSNMNGNEVIATRAGQILGAPVHPNDEVNRSQSSNDVVPSATHVAAALALHERLLPAVRQLIETIREKADQHAHVVKTGRTHLMDAVPIRLDQELAVWAAQLTAGIARLEATQPRLHALALGGTAVGTGLNAPPGFAARAAAHLAQATGLPFVPDACPGQHMASQDTAVELSGQLKTLAVTLMKIANDLRWMNSGRAGLGEITLEARQPGSSIMPGKVNPVVPEAVCMVAAQVMGHDVAIAVAGQSGSFQLNVMLPLVAYNLLQSLEILAAACERLAPTIAGFGVNEAHLAATVAQNPILVTALNALIGYDQGARIAKQAYAEGRPVLDVAVEVTGRDRAELAALLDPRRQTGPDPVE